MKATKRPGVVNADATTTQRLNIRIDAAVYQRLMITCVMSKRAPGDVVSELIETNLRKWKVQVNSGPRLAPSTPLESERNDDEVKVSDAEAA